MTNLAIGLVLLSALFHATWNLLSKKAGGSLPFVWLFSFLMTIIYGPIAFISLFILDFDFEPIWLAFMFGTGCLHITYFLMLTRGYRTGDLSIIYPLARGTGPMLATVAAIVLFAERPTVLAIFGIICIGIGVFIFTGGWQVLRDSRSRQAIGYALFTGVIIATYTIWDKYGVSVLLIPPILYEWSGDFFRTVVLGWHVRQRWDEVEVEWQEHRREAIGIAILSPLAYILVLIALQFSPVSYIAPFREVSILVGAIMGTYLLSEGQMKRRWSAATVIVIGVLALAFG